MPTHPGADANLISIYPQEWTSRYLESHYERLDPAIEQALSNPEPFEWGPGMGAPDRSKAQQELFDEAATFGIRYGFTIPIHDSCGRKAAVTLRCGPAQPDLPLLYREDG
jgi:hypothetical protein